MKIGYGFVSEHCASFATKKSGFFFVKIIVYMVIKYTIKSNVLYIMKKKILYTSNGGGQMIVWPPDFPVWGGPWPLGPPPGYATAWVWRIQLLIFFFIHEVTLEHVTATTKGRNSIRIIKIRNLIYITIAC